MGTKNHDIAKHPLVLENNKLPKPARKCSQTQMILDLISKLTMKN